MLKFVGKICCIAPILLMMTACADDLNVFERLQAMKPEHGSQVTLLPEPAVDDLQGQYELAKQYQEQGNWVSAMQWFSVCANTGHTPCVKELGYGYLQGAGVEADPYLGLQLLQRSLDVEDPVMLNDLAWFMATSTIPKLRNPVKAMELMTRLQVEHELDAMTADTLAAVHAASGNFKQAAQVQKKALNMLLRRGDMAKNILSDYRHRLQLYRSEQAYQE